MSHYHIFFYDIIDYIMCRVNVGNLHYMILLAKLTMNNRSFKGKIFRAKKKKDTKKLKK